MKKLIIFAFILGTAYVSKAAVQDSIGQKVVNGKSYVVYKVEQSETLYSLSKKYNVSVSDINDANDGLKEGLKSGATILIPSASAGVANAAPTVIPKNTISAIHVVSAGETLYAISKKYNVSVDDIKSWNSLASNEVAVGQELKVSSASSSPAILIHSNGNKVSVQVKNDTKPATDGVRADLKYNAVDEEAVPEVVNPKPQYAIDTSLYGEEVTVSKSIDKIKEVGFDQEKNLAQFSGVKVGTILMVVNPVTNKATFVRVVGPSIDENIEVTNAVLKTLGLLAGGASKVNVSYTK